MKNIMNNKIKLLKPFDIFRAIIAIPVGVPFAIMGNYCIVWFIDLIYYIPNYRDVGNITTPSMPVPFVYPLLVGGIVWCVTATCLSFISAFISPIKARDYIMAVAGILVALLFLYSIYIELHNPYIPYTFLLIINVIGYIIGGLIGILLGTFLGVIPFDS